MADPERTRLLETRTRSPPNRPYCRAALAVVLLVTVVVFISIGVHIAYVTSTSTSGSFSSTTLSSQQAFSHSFSAQLKVSKHIGTKDTDTLIDIEWDSEARSLTYQETPISSSFSHDSVITRFVYANKSAVFGLIHDSNEEWFCRNDTESFEWLTVIQTIIKQKVTPFTDSHKNGSTCNGSEYSTTASGKTILLCVKGSRLVYIDHDDARALVTQWTASTSERIKLPQKLQQCNAIYTSIPHLQEGVYSSEDLATKYRSTLLKRKQRKHCLFIHGAGERPPSDTYIDKGALPIYWGSYIESYTPQCLTRRFMWYNSIDRGWDDTKTQQMFCEFAVGNSSRPISDTMIFTHSLGNLVVAAAFHRRFCQFDHRTSVWYAIQAPWRGSKVSNELHTLCSKKNFETHITYIVLRDLHYCKRNSNHPSQAYVTLNTSYVSPTGVSFNDLIQTARRYISGAVCGTSAFGMDLSFSMSARLHLVSAYTQLSLPNDGLVAFESCNIKGDFDIRPSSRYYKGHFNHAEGTCRFGERKGVGEPAQHPCLWYWK